MYNLLAVLIFSPQYSNTCGLSLLNQVCLSNSQGVPDRMKAIFHELDPHVQDLFRDRTYMIPDEVLDQIQKNAVIPLWTETEYMNQGRGIFWKRELQNLTLQSFCRGLTGPETGLAYRGAFRMLNELVEMSFRARGDLEKDLVTIMIPKLFKGINL